MESAIGLGRLENNTAERAVTRSGFSAIISPSALPDFGAATVEVCGAGDFTIVKERAHGRFRLIKVTRWSVFFFG
jgi:hypothetical protein